MNISSTLPPSFGFIHQLGRLAQSQEALLAQALPALQRDEANQQGRRSARETGRLNSVISCFALR